MAFICLSGQCFQIAYKALLEDWNGGVFQRETGFTLITVGALSMQVFKTGSIAPTYVPESIAKLIDDYVELRALYIRHNDLHQRLFIRVVNGEIKPIDEKNYLESVQPYFPGISAKDL